jgi:hypothetical protein
LKSQSCGEVRKKLRSTAQLLAHLNEKLDLERLQPRWTLFW